LLLYPKREQRGAASMENYADKCLGEHIEAIVKQREEISRKLAVFSQKIIATLRSGNKVLLAGNGGSASDAQHIAAEFVGRFKLNRPPLPALALTTDTSILTAVGNDFGFDRVFSRQVSALGAAGDILLVFSTSGNSQNLVEAVHAAKEVQVTSLGFLGKTGGALVDIVDDCIVVSCENTPIVQEIHITMGHILCDIVEREFFGKAV